VFTARYALSPYIKLIRFVFKGLKYRFLGTLSWSLPYSFPLLCRDSPTRAQVSRPHTITHTHTTGTTPLNERSARRRGRYLHKTQHSQETDTRALGGIRTHDPSKRSAADPRLGPRGHWDRPPCSHCSMSIASQCRSLENSRSIFGKHSANYST
jgi:hypothetical protein